MNLLEEMKELDFSSGAKQLEDIRHNNDTFAQLHGQLDNGRAELSEVITMTHCSQR